MFLQYFPIVRLFGTLSWVAAGFAINFGLGWFVPSVEATVFPLFMSSVASVVAGIYCFFLPRTEVPKKGARVTFADIINIDALRLVKKPGFAVFLGTCVLIGIPMQMYFAGGQRFDSSHYGSDVNLVRHMRDFCDGARPVCDARDGLAALRMVEAVRASFRSAGEVKRFN